MVSSTANDNGRHDREDTAIASVHGHPDIAGLMSRVPAILYIADVGGAGRWHYVSPQIEEILGFAPDEWCARPRLWAERIHPEDRPRILAAEAAMLAGVPDTTPQEY